MLALIRRCPGICADGFRVFGDLVSRLSSPLRPLAPLSSLLRPVCNRRLSALTVHLRANSMASPVPLLHDEAEGSSFLQKCADWTISLVTNIGFYRETDPSECRLIFYTTCDRRNRYHYWPTIFYFGPQSWESLNSSDISYRWGVCRHSTPDCWPLDRPITHWKSFRSICQKTCQTICQFYRSLVGKVFAISVLNVWTNI